MNESETYFKLKYIPIQWTREYFKSIPEEVFIDWYKETWHLDVNNPVPTLDDRINDVISWRYADGLLDTLKLYYIDKNRK